MIHKTLNFQIGHLQLRSLTKKISYHPDFEEICKIFELKNDEIEMICFEEKDQTNRIRIFKNLYLFKAQN